MRFLVDENVFPAITSHLKEQGHDVKDVLQEGLTRIHDDDLIRLARKEQRTLITFDKHFGDILRYPPEENEGIVLIRLHPPILAHVVKAMDRFLAQTKQSTLKGKLIVLSRTGYRIR